MTKFKKRISLFLGTAALCLISASLAANGLNLNGMGSRALGMGGACIAIADDASVFFFNPAGATRIKGAMISLFETNLMPAGTYKLSLAMVDAKAEKKTYPAGALGFLKSLSDKLYVGIGAYTPSGTGATWNGADLKNLTKSTPYKWESFLGVVTVSPLVAYKISDAISIGATLNLDYGWLEMNRPALGQYEEKVNGFAVGATLGVQIKPTEVFSLGFTYRTPVKVTLKGDAKMSMASVYGLAAQSEITRKTTFPYWMGLGIAIKPLDRLTITADINMTNWKKLKDIPMEYTDATWNGALASAQLKPYFDQTFDLKWTDCVQVRLGAEYMATPKFALRVGYYSDPSPSPLETMNILLPQIPYDAWCAGAGYTFGKFTVNAAVEILKGTEKTVPLTGKMPGIHGMDINVVNFSINYQL